jgi:hypothetical protein
MKSKWSVSFNSSTDVTRLDNLCPTTVDFLNLTYLSGKALPHVTMSKCRKQRLVEINLEERI